MRLVVKDDEFGRSYEIPEGASIIGRSPDCDISIPASTISKEHVEITNSDGLVSIRDLGTTNGSYLNGMRVSVANLKHNDVITIGRVSLLFDATGAAAPPPGSGVEAAGGVHFDAADAGQPFPSQDEPIPLADGEPDKGPAMPDGQPFGAGIGSDSDTPVDGDFVPTRYEPERHVGPQLVTRDGRWFIRDAATDREVEIVPKGGAGIGQPDMIGYYTDRKKKRVTQMVTAGVALLTALVLLLAFLPTGPTTPTGETNKFPGAKYDAAVDKGIEALDANDFAGAKKIFADMHQRLPQRSVAGIFKEIADLFEKAGEDMSGLDWATVHGHLEDIVDARFRTAKAESYAVAKLKWIKRQRQQESILKYARKLHAEGRIEDAYKALRILREGPVRTSCLDFIKEVKTECAQKTMAEAAQLKGSREWESAIEAYGKARIYVDDTKPVDDALEECRRGMADKTLYEDAVNLNEQSNYGQAKAKLEQIPQKSVYHVEANALLATVIHSQKAKHANELFDSGNGEEAISFVSKQLPDGAMPGFLQTVGSAMKLNAGLKTALDGQEYNDVLDICQKLTELLSDRPDNFYRRKAESASQKLKNNPMFLAKFYTDKAMQAGNDGHPQDARKFAGIASKWSPEKRYGDTVIKQLQTMARRLYNDGREAFFNKNDKLAKEKLTECLRYVTPDHRLYGGAMNMLSQIKERNK